jgi:cytochrome c
MLKIWAWGRFPTCPVKPVSVQRCRPSACRNCYHGLLLIIVGSTLLMTPPGLAAAGGKELFEKRCGGCHALDRDKEGPRLGGVYGRAAGSVDSFQYSEALKKSKITWTEATLDKWLTDTEKLVPDNDMTFHVEKPDERAEIIAYLKQNSGK